MSLSCSVRRGLPRRLAATIAFGAALVSHSAFGADAHAELMRFINGVHSFDAQFEQVRSDDKGAVSEQSSGHFWLQRPTGANQIGRFRWETSKPYSQLTLCDGKELWTFDPDLNQATERPADGALQGTPAALLSQRADLDSAFRIEDGGTEGSAQLLRLIPKSADGDFQLIELALGADGAPQWMRFHDSIGGISEVRFSDIHTNTSIDPARFQFKPPAGVEVVKDSAH